MRPAWTVSSRLHPTPQYGHTVRVTVWASGSQAPAARSSCSDRNMRAPVGHTAMQLPQKTQAESVRGRSCSTAIVASNPRPATVMAYVCWAASPHASTHR